MAWCSAPPWASEPVRNNSLTAAHLASRTAPHAVESGQRVAAEAAQREERQVRYCEQPATRGYARLGPERCRSKAHGHPGDETGKRCAQQQQPKRAPVLQTAHRDSAAARDAPQRCQMLDVD